MCIEIPILQFWKKIFAFSLLDFSLLHTKMKPSDTRNKNCKRSRLEDIFVSICTANIHSLWASISDSNESCSRLTVHFLADKYLSHKNRIFNITTIREHPVFFFGEGVYPEAISNIRLTSNSILWKSYQSLWATSIYITGKIKTNLKGKNPHSR